MPLGVEWWTENEFQFACFSSVVVNPQVVAALKRRFGRRCTTSSSPCGRMCVCVCVCERRRLPKTTAAAASTHRCRRFSSKCPSKSTTRGAACAMRNGMMPRAGCALAKNTPSPNHPTREKNSAFPESHSAFLFSSRSFNSSPVFRGLNVDF